MAEPVISFSGATRTFPARRGPGVTAVDDVDLDIAEGGITGVIGWSGAGKSTLVRMINALELPTSGTVTVRGRVTSELSERGLRELRGEVGMIFQQFALMNSRTVAGNVGYPLAVAGRSREERRARVAELLEFVGLAELAGRYRELGTTVVVITHEMEVVADVCDRVVVMEQGRVIEDGEVYDVFAAPSHPATRRFVHGVLQDVPSPETLARLRERHPGRLVTVGVGGPGSAAADAQDAIARVPAAHGVRATVVHGGIRELSGRPVGSLTLALTGVDAAVDACVDELSRVTRVTPDGAVTTRDAVTTQDEESA